MSNVFTVYDYIDRNSTHLKPGETGCPHHLLVHAKRCVKHQELMQNIANVKKKRWWNEKEEQETDKTGA